MAIQIKRKAQFWIGVAEAVLGLVATYFWSIKKGEDPGPFLVWVFVGAGQIWQSTRNLPAFDSLATEAKVAAQKKWLMMMAYIGFVLVLVGLVLAFVFKLKAPWISFTLLGLVGIGTGVSIFRYRARARG